MSKQISVSAINTFADCPKKYKFQYIDRIYRPSNEHFVFGIFGHKILEFIGMGLSDEEIITNMEIDIESHPMQLALEKFKITDVYELMHNYITILRGFLKKYVVISTETKIRDDENVGVIDLIVVEPKKHKLLIVDYKFTKYPKNESDIENNLQLYMYAKLLNSMDGIEDIIEKYNIRHVHVGYLSLSKTQTQEPKMLKSGKLSKAKNDAITYDSFLEAIKKHDLDVADYEDHLEKLKAKSNNSIDFVEMKLHKNDLEEKLKDIHSWTKLIQYATENNYFPGRDAWNCSKCDIMKQCKNHIKTFKGGNNE